MGKYLDKTGLQYFYNKLKEKFADKSTIDAKLDSLTGALTWKGKKDTLPTDLTDYSAGNTIGVGSKEYVCTEVDGVKSWDELGDEGSYLLKTTAEDTYLKKAAGEVKTANLADGSVTKAKLDSSVQTSLGKADNSVQLYAINPAKQHYPTVFLDDDLYGCLEVRDASDTNILNYQKPNLSIRKDEVFITGKDTDLSRGTHLSADGLEINGKDIGSHFIGLGETNKLKLGGTSLTSKETLGGVATPIEDTDAANKAYVDGKVNSTNNALSNAFYALRLHHDNTDEHKADNVSRIKAFYQTMSKCFNLQNNVTEFPITFITADEDGDMTDFMGYAISSGEDGYTNGYVINSFDSEGSFDTYKFGVLNHTGYVTLNKIEYVDDQKALATVFEAVVISDDEESNLVNIRNYEKNLQNLGVTLSKAPIIPISYGEAHGYVQYTEVDGTYSGIMSNGDGTNIYHISINNNGFFSKIQILTEGNSIIDDIYGIDSSVVEIQENLPLKADKTVVASSLQAITIYTDNTAAHKAANLANIKAYEDNLKSMGVDTAKDNHIPIAISGTIQKGFLVGNTATNRYQGMMGQDTQWSVCVVGPDGTFPQDIVLTDGRIISSLTTTNKQIIPAINEVNGKIGDKQDKTDNSLITNNKTIVDAINENTEDIATLSGSMANCIKTNEDATLNGIIVNDDINFKVTGKEGSFIRMYTNGVDGELEFSSDVDQVKLKNISIPDDDYDAVNKYYVDQVAKIKTAVKSSNVDITLEYFGVRNFVLTHSCKKAIFTLSNTGVTDGLTYTFAIFTQDIQFMIKSYNVDIRTVSSSTPSSVFALETGAVKVTCVYSEFLAGWVIYKEQIS